MRKSFCIQWYEKILKEMFISEGLRNEENPCIKFVKNAKLGKYDELTDDEYEILLAEAEEISSFWNSERYKKCSEVLQNSLRKIKPKDETFHKLAEILADCYDDSLGPFAPEFVITDENGYLDISLDYSDLYMKKEANPKKKVIRKREFSSHIADFVAEKGELTLDSIIYPKQIYDYLSERIHGQKEAVKAASMLLFNHMHKRKRNILFAGPTGCGKTEIWRVLKQLYPYIQIVDSTMITQQGWSGDFKLKDIFAGMHQEEIEKSIIVFDEFDKFCEPKFTSQGNNVSKDGQNELLKMIEGNTITFPEKNGNQTLEFDSSKISFVFCGSFEQLLEKKTEKESSVSMGFGGNIQKQNIVTQYQKEITPRDLVTYAGVRKEIAGRMNQIVQLYPMTEEDYNRILCDKKMSPLYQLERQYGIKLHLQRETRQRLITEAAESHMGVRYLRSRIQQLLDDQIFENCGKKEYELGA